MGYLIRMAPEVEEWLAAVRDRDPVAAERIDEAVAAVRVGGESVGPPLVVPLDDDPSLDARPDLDTAYERQLEMLTRVRRAVATVATSRKRLELQAIQLEQQIGKLGEQGRKAMEAGRGDLAEEAGARRGAAQEQLADLQRQYADMQVEEGRLTVASQRLQAKVDAFRTRKEAIKAAQAAAEAAAEAAWAEAVIDDASADTEGARPVAGAARDPAPPGPARSSLELSELRPGPPGLSGTRILFTVEPPGTAVLLAAGTESDWLRAWYTEAIANCRIRYQREQGNPS
ncbi:MAG: PspA/IM30 family protein [Streptosporangiaceae bacterium]